MMNEKSGIQLIGCRENNLKNISVCIPYSKIVSFIGVSGSGKSTLVFDTLFAEGKRRYIESLGINEAYFLSKLVRPDADFFLGLPPAIALAQRHNAKNARSTAGTISQAAYYVQVLFSTCGDNPNHKITLTPSMFNVNSPSGMCPECGGEGIIYGFDETLIWPDQNLSFSEDGLKLGGAKKRTAKYSFMVNFLKQYGCNEFTPIRDYPQELKVALLFGQKKNRRYKLEFPGIIPSYEKMYRTTKSTKTREEIERYMFPQKCKCCNGSSYNPDSLSVLLGGKRIDEVMNMSIKSLVVFLEKLAFQGEKKAAFNNIMLNLSRIFKGCSELGIDYLSLSRKANTLSGGEFQRLHLIAQISNQISGVVYVLDEPSSGMHISDIENLLRAIHTLNQTGNKNTIVMVEHTRMLINASDYIFELGPGAGINGGSIIAEGRPKDIWTNPASRSGKYLSGQETPGIINNTDSCEFAKSIRIINAHCNNLRNIDVTIPLYKLVCVTGVSGSGKTSLVFDALYQSIKNNADINLDHIEGRDNIQKIILCDQSPMGISSRSCPATYLEFYQAIREKFSNTPEAQKAKLGEKYFSYNLEYGQCPKCKGNGYVTIDMAFLADVLVVCDECQGKRFRQEILAIKYNGKNILDVLNMEAQKGLSFFDDDKVIKRKIQAMCDVGLNYLRLGQMTSTLSGGETQRLKLAVEISKPRSKDMLFIFDEPSKGLHFEDVKKLLQLFALLVNEKNTVLIIEHNLDIISTADYVIDLGPYAGEHGGQICGLGTPKQVSYNQTPTGNALRKYFLEH